MQTSFLGARARARARALAAAVALLVAISVGSVGCGDAGTDPSRPSSGKTSGSKGGPGVGDGVPGVATDGGWPPSQPSDGGGAPSQFPRLPDVTFPPVAHARGSGLSMGVVTGRIYADLAMAPAERMRDFAALGVRILRLEIERATPLSDYAKIAAAAKDNGIEILALFTQNSLAAASDPMAGTRADFDGTFVPKMLAAIDAASAAIPGLRYVEVWNEPDVYAFTPFYAYSAGTCTPLEGSYRYALLTVRVFEALNERRKSGTATPTMVAFDFSHQDDECVLSAVADAPPIASHRSAYRAPNGLPDGLPTDIVSIHGYGLPNRIPGELGYTYAGGTFADGVTTFLDHQFADGRRMIGAAPVWYTEVGFCIGGIGGADPLQRQQQAVTGAMTALRSHSEITAAFLYSYRDDEGSGGERCGLRNSSSTSYAVHPAYEAFQAQAVTDSDVVGPGGAITTSASSVKAGAAVDVTGWAIDADALPPTVAIFVDGAVVATVQDGSSPNATGCSASHSMRCPNVGFEVAITAPTTPGVHEVAVRATDAKGNARVIGRVALAVAP
jgi:hypothetical protein